MFKRIKKKIINKKYKAKYNNLLKKYDRLTDENELLKKKLDTDNNLMIIESKNKTIKRLNNIVKNLRGTKDDK